VINQEGGRRADKSGRGRLGIQADACGVFPVKIVTACKEIPAVVITNNDSNAQLVLEKKRTCAVVALRALTNGVQLR